MNGAESVRGALVPAVLPSGTTVQIRVVDEPAEGIGSVGLAEKLHLEEALAQIGEVASLVRQHLEPVMPTKATVEFGVSFSGQSGKLTSLLFEGKGDASLTVSLEWETRPDRRGPAGSGS